MAPRAVIFGCSGPGLEPAERAFFAENDPLGFILFARNCDAPAQVRALVAGLRDAVGRDDAPVLIDQEGGRVRRLGPPHWRAAPAARVFGDLAEVDLDRAREATRLNAALIGAELAALGVDVDCLPVLDVPVAGAHDIIGDRAFSNDPAVVAALGRAACDGLLDAGVAPVVKHLPGHGRAGCDSHLDLPVVDAPHDALAASDFEPFRALADAPWGMTAHVLYTALDPDRCATLSPAVIGDVIRGEIGFDNALISDDIGMKALRGSFRDRAARALDAGCDVVLHCSGDMDEMRSVIEAVPPLAGPAAERVARAAVAKPGKPIDVEATEHRLAAVIGSGTC